MLSNVVPVVTGEECRLLTLARLPLQKDRMPWHFATRTKQSTMPASHAMSMPLLWKESATACMHHTM